MPFYVSPLHFLSVFSLVFLPTPTENVWKFFPQKICVYIVSLTYVNVEIDNGSLARLRWIRETNFDRNENRKICYFFFQREASSCSVAKNNSVLIVFIVIITDTHTEAKKTSQTGFMDPKKWKLRCAYQFNSLRTACVYETFAWILCSQMTISLCCPSVLLLPKIFRIKYFSSRE